MWRAMLPMWRIWWVCSMPASGWTSASRSPGDYDPTYWWPLSAGYDRSAIARSTYPPISSWQVLGEALQRTGMTADEAALVLGGNMMRVAEQVWG